MTRSFESPHTAPSSTPASRSTGSGSLPYSPSSTSLAIRAINPSPVKQAHSAPPSTDSLPAPPAPPRPSLNLALANPSLPPRGTHHARSVSGTLSSLFGRRAPLQPPDSPASDCATRASSPSCLPSPASTASLPFSHAPTSPIKLGAGRLSASADHARPRLAASPSTPRDKRSPTALQPARSSAAPPPSPKVIAKRKRRFLLQLLWRRKKGAPVAQGGGVAEPRSARVDGARELGSSGDGERRDVAAWVSKIESRSRGAQREGSGGAGRSGWAWSEAGESSLEVGGSIGRGGKAAAAAYYASRPTPYRCSPSFTHLHPRLTTSTLVASTSARHYHKKPLRHPPSSPRKVTNRPRPIERRTSTIGLFSFGHGYRNGAEEQTGEMRTAGGQSGGRGDEEERDHDEEGSAELDDGDSDFEDLEPDLDLEPVAQRRFARSPAPSPASSRFLRSSRTSRRLGLSPLKFGGSTSADAAAKGRSSPVWYAQARVRVEPSFALAPAADDDHCSSLVDPHTLTSHRPGPALSPSSSRPSSAASSTLSSSSDASSAQDLATAQIVVHAQSRSSFEQQEHEQQQVELGAYAYRRSSVGTIVPRLRALEPMSPFKPRFEAVDEPGPSSASHETGGAHDKDAGDPSLALAHLGSPAFRLDSDDPTALAALRRAGEHVFGPASSARPAPLWAAQQRARALGPPPPFGATSEGGLDGGEGPQSPGSPDSASRLRAGAGSMGEGGSGSERGKTGAERGSGARRVLGERQT